MRLKSPASRLFTQPFQRKYQSSASLAFVRGIHRWPVNSPHRGSVALKLFPFDDVIIISTNADLAHRHIYITRRGRLSVSTIAYRFQEKLPISYQSIQLYSSFSCTLHVCCTLVCYRIPFAWWRHDMQMLPVLICLCDGNRWISITNGRQCETFMFYVLLAWTSCWTNSRNVCELS